MPLFAFRTVAAIALLWLTAPAARAQPAAVSPFPRGLSGTIAFQSDVRTPRSLPPLVRRRSIERLTTFFPGHAFMPGVSPDGNWVAFVAATFPVVDGWANQVHVLELATKQTWPFDTTAPGCWPNWSPDGRSITHVSLLNEPSSIQTINSFGEAPQLIPGPDWKPR